MCKLTEPTNIWEQIGKYAACAPAASAAINIMTATSGHTCAELLPSIILSMYTIGF